MAKGGQGRKDMHAVPHRAEADQEDPGGVGLDLGAHRGEDIPIMTPMQRPALPEGYVEIRKGRDRVILREDFRDLLEGRDLADLQGLREGAEVLPSRGRSRVHALDLGDGRRGILKESRRGGLLRGLLGNLYLGDARFVEEIRVTAAAGMRGIRVASIVASVTRPAALGFCRHHYIVLEMKGRDLRSVLEGESPGTRDLFPKVADALRGLHDAGICHADLNLGNIIVGDAFRIGFVDLDTSRMVERIGFPERVRNLIRLYRSALKMDLVPSVPERARFLRAYFEQDREALRGAWIAFRRATPRLLLHRLLWSLGIR